MRRSPAMFFTVVLITLLFSLAAFSIPQASAYNPACGQWELRRNYYTDASHTVEVGYLIQTCDCEIITSGQYSTYHTDELLSCP